MPGRREFTDFQLSEVTNLPKDTFWLLLPKAS